MLSGFALVYFFCVYISTPTSSGQRILLLQRRDHVNVCVQNVTSPVGNINAKSLWRGFVDVLLAVIILRLRILKEQEDQSY